VSYDSNGVHHLTGDGNGGSFWISNISFLSQGGWAYSAPLLSIGDFSVPWFNGGGTCSVDSDFGFQEPTGGRHVLGLSTTSDNQGGDGSAACGVFPVTSGGDDFFKATTTSAVVSPTVWIAGTDGTLFRFPDSNPHNVGC